MMNNQGRPSAAGVAQGAELPTISGDRGLDHEEALIFELGREGMTGVDIPEVQLSENSSGRPAPQSTRWVCRGSRSRKSCAITCACHA